MNCILRGWCGCAGEKARVRRVERVTGGIKSDWRCVTVTRTGLAWVEYEAREDGTERKRKENSKGRDPELKTID